ncbi:MAG: C_GCAxxG_C_C family protein [Spirochaetes bacterium]|nr:C_GCAxxG_C_C family protein [Spirochaetota bacterium]
MSKRSDIAVQKFKEGYNCAQAVLFSFCDELQIEKDLALKLACGFGAGIGRKQEVCGAVTGSAMVLGKKYGRGEREEISATENTYTIVREFIHKFEKKNGSIICGRLLNGCELLSQEGKKYFQENDLITRICIPCVKSAVEILEEM